MIMAPLVTISAIICAGLSCLDLQLLGCTKSGQEEAIEQYEKAVYCAGGSASMAATTLALICNKHLNDGDPQQSSSSSVYVLTKLGNDPNGNMMLNFYKDAGANTDLCLMDDNVSTAMAVLPVFKVGGRGCFFNLACNDSFTKDELLQRLDTLPANKNIDAFLFGYPHLMPQMQGESLKGMIQSIRDKLGGHDLLIGVDLNGVSADNHKPELLSPALSQVDVLHLNEEEAEILSGHKKEELFEKGGSGDAKLQAVTQKLHDDGCAIVLLSLGSKGSYLSVTSDKQRLAKCPIKSKASWTASSCASSVRVPAYQIDGEGNVNANGAGDALFAGFCWVVATQSDLSLEQCGQVASLIARQRCDIRTRDTPSHTADDIVELVKSGKNLPRTMET